tara:strand:+ start:881 stop:997 length:117 start_codon:yes stop_codon:yes gene_type:complete
MATELSHVALLVLGTIEKNIIKIRQKKIYQSLTLKQPT